MAMFNSYVKFPDCTYGLCAVYGWFYLWTISENGGHVENSGRMVLCKDWTYGRNKWMEKQWNTHMRNR